MCSCSTRNRARRSSVWAMHCCGRTNWADAEAAYKTTLAIKPDSAGAHANLGLIYYQMGQLSKAADECEAALRIDPNNAVTTYILGAVRSLEKDFPEAERLLLKARDLDPKLPDVYIELGVIYKLNFRNAEAIAAYEKFLQLDTGQNPQLTEFAKSELEWLRRTVD